jgi:hypothetical protein
MGALHETYMCFCRHPNQNMSGINVQRNEPHVLCLKHFSHTRYTFQGSSGKESGFRRTVNVLCSAFIFELLYLVVTIGLLNMYKDY